MDLDPVMKVTSMVKIKPCTDDFASSCITRTCLFEKSSALFVLSKPSSSPQSASPASPCTAADLRREALAAELQSRLREGGGETLWEVEAADADAGGGDDAFAAVCAAAASLGATATVLRRTAAGGGELLVRRGPGEDGEGPVDVRVAVVGNVDSGKSTLVGVLTSGQLDNGRGLARSKVAPTPHPHPGGGR